MLIWLSVWIDGGNWVRVKLPACPVGYKMQKIRARWDGFVGRNGIELIKRISIFKLQCSYHLTYS